MFEKKKSKLQGWGIFSKRRFNKGELIYTVPVELVQPENNPNYAYIGDGKYVCDEKVLNYVNHSCNPNTKLILKDIPKLVALRNIEPQEEITCDYDISEINGFSFACNCEEKNCNQVIGKS